MERGSVGLCIGLVAGVARFCMFPEDEFNIESQTLLWVSVEEIPVARDGV